MKAMLIALMGLLGFTVAAKPPEVADPAKPVPLPVTAVELAATAGTDRPATLQVQGYYPTPAWRFHHWQVTQQGATIEVTPLGVNRLRPDQMVTQVTVPFQLLKALPGLKAGTYTIVVAGKNQTLSAPLTVEEAAMEKGFPYVDSVKVPQCCKAGAKVKVTITGNLPDMAWKPLDAEVIVKKDIVWIHPWAERKRGAFAAEALKPATWHVTLPALPAGDYQVIVSGRNEEHASPLKIANPGRLE